MIYVFFATIFLVPVVIYVIVAMMEVPGMADERLGVLEDIPDDVNEWKVDLDSPQAIKAKDDGLICETRLWIDTSFNRKRIFRQVRYLDTESMDVVRFDKDIRVRRKRVKT